MEHDTTAPGPRHLKLVLCPSLSEGPIRCTVFTCLSWIFAGGILTFLKTRTCCGFVVSPLYTKGREFIFLTVFTPGSQPWIREGETGFFLIKNDL